MKRVMGEEEKGDRGREKGDRGRGENKGEGEGRERCKEQNKVVKKK